MSQISKEELAVLEEIQMRTLWLAVRMVDYANHDRENNEGIKVGGHQASSASMISILTSLYMHHLSAHDRVSVKPHSSPVFHSIQYLLGNLGSSFVYLALLMLFFSLYVSFRIVGKFS